MAYQPPRIGTLFAYLAAAEKGSKKMGVSNKITTMLDVRHVLIRMAVLWALCAAGTASAQTVSLDDFEAGSIRETNVTDPDPVRRLLWSQFEGDPTEGPDPGTESISSATAHDGTRSLNIRVSGGNLYMHFFPYTGSIWNYLREKVQGAWTLNAFNRMRIWIKVPPQVNAATPGQTNLHIGTYFRASGGDPTSAESGGNHYYHHFNIPYTGEWHQLIVDTHPDHIRGGAGGTEWGDRSYPTGESTMTYFDLMTRFYMDFKGALSGPLPADFYIDDIELYRETNPENMSQIYNMSGVYVPSENRIRVGWRRHKDENNVVHEVRYAFQDVFALGWANATAAPDGSVTPPGWQGFNGMEWSTTGIDVTGQTRIYIAIKPTNSTQFRQIQIPLGSGAGPAYPSAPTNLRIVS